MVISKVTTPNKMSIMFTNLSKISTKRELNSYFQNQNLACYQITLFVVVSIVLF